MGHNERASDRLPTKKTDEGLTKLTDYGRELVEPLVTSVDDQVVVFTNEADPLMVAAAMARLSRNPNDVRTILADEFLGKHGMDDALLKRVITAYGDDSVMQLYPIMAAFENVSNLATKQIEWGRLAAYLEQSTRYLRFDRRDENGRYRYHTPEEFDEETTEVYEEQMDQIFDTYSGLYEKVLAHIKSNSTTPESERDGAWANACHAQACDSIRGLLPSATTATVGFQGSAHAFYNLILHMESETLPELRNIGRAALKAARIVAPVFFERVDMPTSGMLLSDNRRETRAASRAVASELFEQYGTPEQETGIRVSLLGVDGSEDELITKILTDSSEYSFESIAAVVAQMSEEDKTKVVDAYVGERFNRRVKPGRAFEFPHYLFEVQCDYGAFRDIQRHRLVDGFEWQRLRPTLGHGRPAVIDEAGLVEEYESAFAVSQSLYDYLDERGYEEQAQYATLFGHIMRFTTKVNARALIQSAELRTTPQGHPSYRRVYQEMVDAVSQEHPHVVRVMKFLNKSEDLELARLGAEQAQQRKLAALDAQE